MIAFTIQLISLLAITGWPSMARAQQETSSAEKFAQVYFSADSLTGLIGNLKSRVPESQLAYLKSQAEGIKRQKLGHLKIDDKQTITIFRDLDVLTFSQRLPVREPAASSETFTINGRDIEVANGESIETSWQKVRAELAKSRVRSFALFVQPGGAADFEPDTLPVNWMPSPFQFSEMRSRAYDSDGYFTSLTIAGIALLTSH